MEKEVRELYNSLTIEELVDLNYTGEWLLDKRRFTKEYEKNLEVLTLNLDDLLSFDEYEDDDY